MISPAVAGRPRGRRLSWHWVLAFLVGAARGLAGVEAADGWLTNAPPPPPAWGAPLPGEPAPDIAASVVDRRLGVGFTPGAALDPEAMVVLVASTGAPGHWRSRDWRSRPMTRAEARWTAILPLTSVEVPVVYFLSIVDGGRTNATDLRLFQPRLAGLSAPTFPFTGYLDGFEEGLGSWEPTVAVGGKEVWGPSTNALSGRSALRLSVPAGRGSMTIGTVRVQGWMLDEHAPIAVRFAARTEFGSGRVGCALHSHARTEELAVHPALGAFEVGPSWQRLEIPMAAFAGLRPSAVDWFTVQFFAEPGRALLLDDVELVLR